MKLFTILPIALGNRISNFMAEIEGLNELKFGHSLCESNECPSFDEKQTYGNVIVNDEISTASCSQSYKNSFLSSKMDRCEYYNADHTDCVKWATQELESACGGSYNCVETKWSNVSGWGTYWGYSSK